LLTRGGIYEYCDIVDDIVSEDGDDEEESINEDRERGIRRTVDRDNSGDD
jgi:hypothetical protein